MTEPHTAGSTFLIMKDILNDLNMITDIPEWRAVSRPNLQMIFLEFVLVQFALKKTTLESSSAWEVKGYKLPLMQLKSAESFTEALIMQWFLNKPSRVSR